ncbi:hypothetical protein G7066_04485 [Leucobacter coleopterorum]|uniref:Uncharacterized protein n=1 Tax=Leucobacter coleopterorum TaxID=2714933 RepID=A0ABX6JUZ1_9MICO|nr:hypothetical protein [Leucobacter coleopterorum]QIM18100.1 hypothetical protein G7066_04485 [Leucobacter coleopterorum]
MAIKEANWVSPVRENMPALRSDLERLMRVPSMAIPGFPEEPVLETADEVERLLRGVGIEKVSQLNFPPFAAVGCDLTVATWNADARWMSIWRPTSDLPRGDLAIAAVGYNKYIKFILPLTAALLVAALGVLLLATALG